MARPKKIVENENIESLTTQQVWDVVEFSKYLNNMYPGIFNPDLVNARLKDINSNPSTGTTTDITNALKDPKNYEDKLRSYSEYFDYSNMGYKKVLGYYANMLTFDYTYTCTNAPDDLDYKSSRYKSDEKEVIKFLDKFNVKKEFQKVMRMLLRNDVHYCVLRTDGDQYTLQELPKKYCKITGRFEYGYLFDFDMIYFMSQPGVDINMFPEVFKKYYRRVTDAKNNGYFPGKHIDQRTGEWVYYVQTSPDDGMFAWKLNMEQTAIVPMLSPLFLDFVNTDAIRALQYNKYVVSAYRLLIGKIPLFKDSKTGNVKDMLAISPEIAGKFANLIKQGIPSAIGFGFTPFEEIKEHTFNNATSELNIYNDHLKTTMSNSGAQLQTIFSTEKANVEATRLSAATDEYFMTYIYPYFADFLNFYINKLTKKYKFKFVLKGSHIPFSETANFDRIMTLADKGIVLPHEIAASMHITPQDLERQLRAGKSNGFTELLTPLITAYTNSNKNSGAPQKSDGDISESGSETRASGGNIAKGGNI